MRGAPHSGVLDAHLPYQRTQLGLNLRSSSSAPRFPMPITTKAGPMPTHQRLRTDDGEDVQDRREPSVELDEKPTVGVRQPRPTFHFAPQNNQLLPELCILRLKSALRLEWQSQDAQHKEDQRYHAARIANFLTPPTWMRFSAHTGPLVVERRNRGFTLIHAETGVLACVPSDATISSTSATSHSGKNDGCLSAPLEAPQPPSNWPCASSRKRRSFGPASEERGKKSAKSSSGSPIYVSCRTN